MSSLLLIQYSWSRTRASRQWFTKRTVRSAWKCCTCLICSQNANMCSVNFVFSTLKNKRINWSVLSVDCLEKFQLLFLYRGWKQKLWRIILLNMNKERKLTKKSYRKFQSLSSMETQPRSLTEKSTATNGPFSSKPNPAKLRIMLRR